MPGELRREGLVAQMMTGAVATSVDRHLAESGVRFGNFSPVLVFEVGVEPIAHPFALTTGFLLGVGVR